MRILLFQTANSDVANKAEKQTLEMEQLKDKCVTMANIQLIIDDIQTRIDKIDTKQEKLEFVEFVWNIDNFSDKRDRAQKGIEREIFSDPFYSHRNGYKMCLSVQPAGDNKFGSTKGHLFVRFCLMRGPFDNILQWPFKHGVTLSLVDQQSGLNYHNLTATYDMLPNSVKWNRPTTERNDGIGYSKFVKIAKILNNAALCQNDRIIIKCTVHNH